MKKGYLLDTNFLFSLLSSDSKTKEAEKLFAEIQNENIFIPTIVLAELYASGEEIDFLNIIKILEFQIISIDIPEIKAIEKVENKVRRKLKADDCLILGMALLYNLTLISFDKKLLREYNKLTK